MTRREKALSTGIVSGQRRRGQEEVFNRARLIAGGLYQLGVRQGDSVCILMRNDIAFLEAAYAVMTLGAYAVPVNWHFKPDEINYVIRDSGTAIVIGHDDMLNQLRGAIPLGVTVLSASPPPEVVAAYRIDRALCRTPEGAVDFETWLSRQSPYSGPAMPQPQNMIYTSGTTGNPKGVKRFAPTPEQTAHAEAMRARIYGIKPGVRALLPGPLYHSAPNSFGIRAGRAGDVLVLMPRFDAEDRGAAEACICFDPVGAATLRMKSLEHRRPDEPDRFGDMQAFCAETVIHLDPGLN